MKKILAFIVWFFDITFITYAPFMAIYFILTGDSGYHPAIEISVFCSILGILRMLYRLRKSLQTFFVCLGVWVISLICLFPPWVRTYRIPNSNIKATMPMGCNFLSYPPEVDRLSGVSIDFARIGLECGIVFLITGALYYALSIIQKTKKLTDTEI